MTGFSLITINGLRDEETVPKSLFIELKLNTLFSDNTLDILSHPCGREDIIARQEIIRILETDMCAKERFELLYQKLVRFSKLFAHYNNPDSDCVRLFVFKDCVSCYFSVLDSDLPADCYFCRRLSSYFAELKANCSDMYDTFAEYVSLLDKISKSRIMFSGRGCYLTDDTDNDCRPALDSIIKDAGALGWGHKNTDGGKTIPLLPVLSKYLNALYPDTFEKLNRLEKSLYGGMDIKLLSLISEMDFYFDILNLIQKADSRNIPHTYPTLADSPSFSADELYDITLLSAEIEKIIPNDVRISSDNRCFFICGANGGGKTTYLRSVGSQLIMFLCGCPVFCRSAAIYTYTKIFGHFPKDEDSSHYGRLDREVHDVTEIIEKCDEKSFVLLNETYSGGTQSKAAELALSAVKQLSDKGSSCLFVTHISDVYDSGYPVLSPVVSDDASHTRTYRIGYSDKPGGSYAGDILKKYKLDKKSLGEQ